MNQEICAHTNRPNFWIRYHPMKLRSSISIENFTKNPKKLTKISKSRPILVKLWESGVKMWIYWEYENNGRFGIRDHLIETPSNTWTWNTTSNQNLKTVSSIMANISTRTWTFFSFPICGIVGIWERRTSWDGYNFLRHCFLWKQCNAVIHVDCWDQKYILAHSLVWNHWILVFAEKTEIERDKATGTPYISRKSLCTTR